MDPLNLIAAFGWGALSFLSPCVLPLVPGYLSLMSGYSLQEMSDGTASSRRVTKRTALFVLGFSIVFMATGAAATKVARFILESRSTFETVAGWFIVLMGLFIAFTAVWQPSFTLPMLKERRFEMRTDRLGPAGPVLMGSAFAVGWTPCVGPFLASVYALTGSSDTVFEGVVLLGSYSLGLGLPFLFAALFLQRALGTFSRIKPHLTKISVLSGLLLAVFGIVLLTGNIGRLSGWFSDVLFFLKLDFLTVI